MRQDVVHARYKTQFSKLLAECFLRACNAIAFMPVNVTHTMHQRPLSSPSSPAMHCAACRCLHTRPAVRAYAAGQAQCSPALLHCTQGLTASGAQHSHQPATLQEAEAGGRWQALPLSPLPTVMCRLQMVTAACVSSTREHIAAAASDSIVDPLGQRARGEQQLALSTHPSASTTHQYLMQAAAAACLAWLILLVAASARSIVSCGPSPHTCRLQSRRLAVWYSHRV